MNRKLLIEFLLAIILVFYLCAATTNYTAHTTIYNKLVAIDSVTEHDMIVTDNAENGRNVKLETMGSQIESCLKEGKPMIETMQELKIRPQLAWAVYLHGRENLGVYSYFSNLK